jgi:hypothetical protein
MTLPIDAPASQIRTLYVTEKDGRVAAEARAQTLAQENTILKARIAELEAQPGPAPTPEPEPTPEPAPTPTGKAPAILNENFDGTSLNTRIFVLDKTPPEAVIVSGGQALLKWKATSDLLHMRAQVVMRATPGSTNDTARRDPIGSERYYAFGILLPPAFSFADQWANEKCVSGQFHQGNQGGIVNPPFSFEMIKTSLEGEIMRGVLSLEGRERKVFQLGRPPRSESKIIMHVKWSPGSDGFFRLWRDGVQKMNHVGPTCNPRTLNGETTQDINPMLSNYNPGRKGGAFIVGYERHVVFTYWKIGNETNSLADFA